MRVLIVGCKGLLGQNLLAYAPAEVELCGISKSADPLNNSCLKAYRSVDVTVRADLERAIKDFNPDWIFNAAAMTHVDRCETEPQICAQLNRDSVEWMAASGKPMVHISTDYVFDGEKGPYAEEDVTHPLSVYGQIKLESENIVLQYSSQSLVIRTMLLWGKQMGDKTSFPDFVKNTLEQGKMVRCADDQWGHPTLVDDLAQGIWTLWKLKSVGLFHISGPDYVNRLQWAEAIAQFYGLPLTGLTSVKTSELGQPARRPLKSGLKIDKFVQATGLKPKTLQEQLQFVKNF